jgi:hypothetical protein
MTGFIIKVLFGLIGALILVERLRGGRKIDLKFILESVFVLLSAFAFSAVGFGLYALMSAPARAFGATGIAALAVFALGYTGFALLFLARLAPKGKPLPKWVGPKRGAADYVAGAAAGLGAGAVGLMNWGF